MSTWLILCVAILSEVIATSALKASDGFSRLVPSVRSEEHTSELQSR